MAFASFWLPAPKQPLKGGAERVPQGEPQPGKTDRGKVVRYLIYPILYETVRGLVHPHIPSAVIHHSTFFHPPPRWHTPRRFVMHSQDRCIPSMIMCLQNTLVFGGQVCSLHLLFPEPPDSAPLFASLPSEPFAWMYSSVSLLLFTMVDLCDCT